MAMIDYGAILRVDGKIINHELFMETSDTGYVPETATYRDGIEIRIKDNFYVYAGDKDFMMVFYKGAFYGIHNGEIIMSDYNIPFVSVTYKREGVPVVTIRHLDPNLYAVQYDDYGQSWKDYVKESWIGATGDEEICQLQNGRERHKWFLRYKKRIARNKNCAYKYRTNRYVASWTHNGKSYEVIFGYGIDPDVSVWRDIKNKFYYFTDIEKKIIDGWFGLQ